MKLSFKTLAVLLSAGIMYACNSGDKTSTSSTSSTANSDSATGSDKPAAMDTSHATTDTSSHASNSQAGNPEQDFLNYAVPANTKEIAWLKAGMAKGASRDVKEHSAMMLRDHKKLDATVRDYMSKKPTFAMPSVDTTNVVTINDKTGADFDKAWTDKMVDEHTALLEKLRQAKKDVKDAELSKIINNTIPVVESHLSMAKKMQDKMKH